MSALIALLGFQLLVFVHELGHFLVARACGMQVRRFSIGFGPALVKVTRGGTVYSLCVLPLGGLVQVAGLHGKGEGLPSDFPNKPIWQRTAMVLAGPAFNLLFAGLLAIAAFLSFNGMRHEGRPLATTLLAAVEGPALAAGLRPGDAIVSVNGERVNRLREINERVGASEGHPVKLGVRRPPEGVKPERIVVPYDADEAPGLLVSVPRIGSDWEALEVTVTPQESPRGWRLGLRPELGRFGADGVGSSLTYAFRETWALNAMFVESLGRIFRGEEKAEVTGIVKLVSVGADLVKLGLADWFLDLLVLLGINLAVLNMLPLPALDGGRLLFLLVEAVARRPVPQRLEAWVHATGFVVLLGLLLAVAGQEIWDLVSR